MKLTYEQIKKISKGAVRITEEDGKICFYRFTDEQFKMYENIRSESYLRAFSTAGVRLEFVTNSKTLTLEANASHTSSRTYFNHDIYVDGEHLYTLGDDVDNSPDKQVTVRGEYELGDGEKTVKIYMPWSVNSRLVCLELDDGATLEPVEHGIKMMCFGDSITHGYDAANPSMSYASLLVDALDADAINKGVAGEFFRAELATLEDDLAPDIITVAYGTNDWAGRSLDELERECKGFFGNLSSLYPCAKIFALTPVWRGNCKKITRVGTFDTVGETIKQAAADLSNVTVIDCMDFIPHESKMYSPDALHPNFLGFSFYADGVISAIKGSISE